MTADKRESAKILFDLGLGITRACKLACLARASYYRKPQSWRKKDAAVIDALNEQLKKSPRAGFWKCFKRMRNKNLGFNHKRVYRVYCLMGLNLRRRTKKGLPKRIAKPLEVNPQSNKQWALDFVHGTLYCGERFRALNIIDEGSRECFIAESPTCRLRENSTFGFSYFSGGLPISNLCNLNTIN